MRCPRHFVSRHTVLAPSLPPPDGRVRCVAELPADSHVHTEWSWDARRGSMEQSCARAAALGLRAIAFTEHFDLTRWMIAPEARAAMPLSGHLVGADQRFNPPAFDVEGYAAELARCREHFPQLRIVSGVELGEPHWFPQEVTALLRDGAFERVLGSLHSVESGGERWVVDDLTGPAAPPGLDPEQVVRAYLEEVLRMVQASSAFSVLAHIDYPARGWPDDLGAFPVRGFEEEFRAVLSALAASERALELNTRLPMDSVLLAWWYDAGGTAITFGSDAHEPAAVGHGFQAAAAMAQAHDFVAVPGEATWHRRRSSFYSGENGVR